MIINRKQSYISASILAADFRNLEKEVRAAESAGVDNIHIDVMDGVFVPNISMGPIIVETCRKITNLPLDVHLMIIHPEKYIDTFQQAGANRISIHIENNPIANETLERIRTLGCKAGLVLNPETVIDEIEGCIKLADFFLIMTVNPGFGGQLFMNETLEKISKLHEIIFKLGLGQFIQVDGGINANTMRACYNVGARDFVAGSSIFNHSRGIQQAILEMRESIK